MTDHNREISNQLVRLVQIIFGFVIAQSFNRYDNVIIHPLSKGNYLATLALGVVYLTTILSWIDWHTTMVLRPYSFNPNGRFRLTEQMRLFADLFVVSAYAYLLLTVRDFVGTPDAYIGRFLLGFPIVFGGYIISGALRCIPYGRLASNLLWILVFGGAFTVLYTGYALLFNGLNSWRSGILVSSPARFNLLFVILSLVLMVSYRLFRRFSRNRRIRAKEAGLRLGIDVDGVLANQIDSLLPRIRRRLGIELKYEDVTHWRLPLGATDVAAEIVSAMEDPRYILDMPVHDGARDVVNQLYRDNRIQVITARPSEVTGWTNQWLENHGFSVDGMVSVREKAKSFHATDVLIDDYLDNIIEYLENTNGYAILVDQPWNRERDQVAHLVEQGRLVVVKNIRETPSIFDRIKQTFAERDVRAGGAP